MSEKATGLERDDPTLVANRYEVLGLLGRGGMGVAYRVRDRQSDSELALKRLTVEGSAAKAIELFEREFHTLVQLAHPRVVRVYDYGLDGTHPYYTMELLDGGDLRDLAPLPWQQACVVAYEVCSALSLLHSRGLVHRDLTPGNIRRSRDGQAKLIDFGLLAPMGPVGVVAGTPPFIAPELLSQISLDGRSDLFSLGASLYWALTGRFAFPARRMSQLRDLWRSPPQPPSKFVEDVPEALDALVMALLRIDVSSRPKTAAEVMERLRPLLAHAPAEELAVAGAYLAAPKLVGRHEQVTRLRKLVVRSMRGRGGGFLIAGQSGAGRTRMLDAFVLDAKLLGAAIVRVDPSAAATGPFGAASIIVAQLHAAAPLESLDMAHRHDDVREVLFGVTGAPSEPVLSAPLDVSRPGLERAKVQSALRTWVQGISSRRFVAIAVDDLGLVDDASAGLVASLALGASTQRCAYAVATSDSELEACSDGPLESLGRHATRMQLPPLSLAEDAELLRGVFGDVPNLHALSAGVHGLSEGSPRESMALAQHLVDVGAVSYAGGVWKLPAALAPALLPANLEDAFKRRVSKLSDDAARIGRALTLSVVRTLSRAQLVGLGDLSTARVDAAVDDLRRGHLIAGTPAGYALGNNNAGALLTAQVEAAELAHLHDRLAELLEHDDAPVIAVAHHRLQGGDPDAGLDYLLAHSTTSETRTANSFAGFERVGGDVTARTLELADACANRAARPVRDRMPIWVMLAGAAATGADVRYFDQVPTTWLEVLKQESGFHDWHALGDVSDPATRSIQAFGLAAERHQGVPEQERGMAPADAIKQMVAYVVFAIAVGGRTVNLALLDSLPALLEPFVPLNPMVAAMRLNAQASYMMSAGRREIGRDRCVALVQLLDEMQGVDLAYVDMIRAAICQAVATAEVALGIETDAFTRWSWANDPSQLVGAECIHRVAAIHRGDGEAAENHRRKAEVISLENSVGAMFINLAEELEALAQAHDLTGVRGLRERIRATAARYPGWRGLQYVADAEYHRLCGEPQQALTVVAEARAFNAGQAVESRFYMEAVAVEVEVLVAEGRAQDALDVGLPALARCTERGRSQLGRRIAGSVALAEAALGRTPDARARIHGVLDAQRGLGVRGLLLGRSHEQLARIAILEGDPSAYQRAADQAAAQYRLGGASLLGVLYERLVEEARRKGVTDVALDAEPELSAESSALLSRIETTLVLCTDDRGRARAALSLLCERDQEHAGALFLLTEAGLTLSASIGVAAPKESLATFAAAELELELDDGSCTMTAGMLSNLGDGDAVAAHVTDADGVRYISQVLGCLQDGDFHVVGIAVLGADVEADPQRSAVATAVARHLLDSGNCRPAILA